MVTPQFHHGDYYKATMAFKQMYTYRRLIFYIVCHFACCIRRNPKKTFDMVSVV